jgi:ATP-binding protein involved in chromosome partitioning
MCYDHAMAAMIEPVSFKQTDARTVVIGWRDGKLTTHQARALRLACPCASCIDEGSGRPLLDPGSVPDDVAIVDSDVVGRYAFRFRFSDRHDTGIYTFPMLREMAGV